jgi:hypothetical protein
LMIKENNSPESNVYMSKFVGARASRN